MAYLLAEFAQETVRLEANKLRGRNVPEHAEVTRLLLWAQRILGEADRLEDR